MRVNSGEFDENLFAAAVAEIGELPEPDEQGAAAEGPTIDIKPDI